MAVCHTVSHTDFCLHRISRRLPLSGPHRPLRPPAKRPGSAAGRLVYIRPVPQRRPIYPMMGGRSAPMRGTASGLHPADNRTALRAAPAVSDRGYSGRASCSARPPLRNQKRTNSAAPAPVPEPAIPDGYRPRAAPPVPAASGSESRSASDTARKRPRWSPIPPR